MRLITADNMAVLEEHLTGNICPDTSAIILTPPQASFTLEKKLVKRLGGFCSAQVMSFEKLATHILEEVYGRTLKKLTPLGQMIAVSRVIAENADKLTYFDAQRDDSLSELLSAQITTLTDEGISPQELTKRADETSAPLKDKLNDIALIYAGLKQALAARKDELNCINTQELLCRLIEQENALKGKKLFVFGFDRLSDNKLKLLLSALKAGCEVQVYLELAEGSVFDNQRSAAVKLKATAAAAGLSTEEVHIDTTVSPAQELAEAVYAFPAVKIKSKPDALIYCAKTPKEEGELIAAKILELITEDHGLRLADINIYTRLTDTSHIVNALTLAGIPSAHHKSRKLYAHRLARYILNAAQLMTSSSWSNADVNEYLKSNIVLGREQVDELTAYTSRRGLKGNAYKKPFYDERAEQLRKAAFPFADKRLGAEEAAAQLMTMLKNARELIEQEARELDALGMKADARYTSQVYAKAENVLNEALLYTEAMDVRYLYPVLAAAFSAVEISIVPPVADEVNIYDITRSYITPSRVVFLAGANDGVLPSPPPSGMFTVDELVLLNKDSFFPGLSLPDDQRLYIRRTLASAAEKLIISYNLASGIASVVVDKVKRVCPEIPTLYADNENAPMTKGMLRVAAARETHMGRLGLAEALKQSGDGSVYEYLKYTNEPKRLSYEQAKQLYGGKLKSSISRIELFNSCPYKHFITYGLKPEAPQPFDEDSRMVGTYVHALLDGVTRCLKQQGVGCKNASDEQINKAIWQANEQVRYEHNDGYFLTNKRTAHIEKTLLREVEHTVKTVRDHLNAGNAYISGSEVPFGNKNELELNTAHGAISLKGIIDRIDIAKDPEGNSLLRVVDYKTGSRKYSVKEVYYGLGLQLVVYLMAAMEMYKGAIPAGGFYFNVGLPFSERPEEERFMDMRMNGFLINDTSMALSFDDGVNNKLISMDYSLTRDGLLKGGLSADDITLLMKYVRRLISQAVDSIFEGDVAIRPTKDGNDTACDYCEYHTVCRFGAYAQKYKEVSSKGMVDIKESVREEDEHGIY